MVAMKVNNTLLFLEPQELLAFSQEPANLPHLED
jgi:hypothetical protein